MRRFFYRDKRRERIDQVVSGETRFTDQCPEAAGGPEGAVDDEEDNRRRVGRSSRGSQMVKARMVGRDGILAKAPFSGSSHAASNPRLTPRFTRNRAAI